MAGTELHAVKELVHGGESTRGFCEPIIALCQLLRDSSSIPSWTAAKLADR
jgi:hypothetical protein